MVRHAYSVIFSSHRDASSLYLKLTPSARLVMLKLHIWSVPLCHAHSCDLDQVRDNLRVKPDERAFLKCANDFLSSWCT